MIFIDLIFYARIVAIINEIKIQLQTRPAGWGTKSSCRGCRSMMKMVIMMTYDPLSCDDNIYYDANSGAEEEDKRIGDVEQLLHPWKN